MANRPRCTQKCDFSPKRTDLKEPSRTTGKTPRAEHEKPQLTAASETFLPNGHSTTPPKSPENRQNPFRSVVYGEKNRIWCTVRAGLQYPGTSHPGTSYLRGQGSRRHDVPRGKAPGAVRNARGSRGCPRRARLPGMRKTAQGAQGYPGGGARPPVRAPISNAMRRHARASASSHRNRSPSPARCCRFDAPSSLYSAP